MTLAQLAKRFDKIQNPTKHPDKGGWAPVRIKSSWPTGVGKPTSKTHWSFKKPVNNKPAKPAPKVLSADEILAEL